MCLPCVKHVLWLCWHHGPCEMILISELLCITGREGEVGTLVCEMQAHF